MGTRFRKSINLGGGARINLSKSGVGFSAGVKGARVTKTAKGTTRTTLSIPGSGLSHVTETSASKRHKSSVGYAAEESDTDIQQAERLDGLTEEQIRDSLMRQVCELDLNCKRMEEQLGKRNPEVVKAREKVDRLRLELAKMGIVDFEYPTDSPAPIPEPEQEEFIATPRVSTVFCPGCGSEMTEGERFCPECGQAMGKEAGQAETGDFRDKPVGWLTVVVRGMLWVLAALTLLLCLAASPIGKILGIAFIAIIIPIRQTRRVPTLIRIIAAVALALCFVMSFASV